MSGIGSAPRTRYDVAHGAVAAALHRVRLARPGLHVRKEANVVPVEGSLYEPRHLLENHILSVDGANTLSNLIT